MSKAFFIQIQVSMREKVFIAQALQHIGYSSDDKEGLYTAGILGIIRMYNGYAMETRLNLDEGYYENRLVYKQERTDKPCIEIDVNVINTMFTDLDDKTYISMRISKIEHKHLTNIAFMPLATYIKKFLRDFFGYAVDKEGKILIKS